MRLPTHEDLAALDSAALLDKAQQLAAELRRLQARDEAVLNSVSWLGRASLRVAAGRQLYANTIQFFTQAVGWVRSPAASAFPADSAIALAAALLNRLVRIGLFRGTMLLIAPAVLIAQLAILWQQTRTLNHQLNVESRAMAQEAFDIGLNTRTALSRPPLDRDGKIIDEPLETLRDGKSYARIDRWARPNQSAVAQLRLFVQANRETAVPMLAPLLEDENVSLASAIFAVFATAGQGAGETLPGGANADATEPWRNVHLGKADLSGMDLSGLKWSGGHGAELRLDDAVLDRAHWSKFSFPGLHGEGLQALDAVFRCASFSASRLDRAELRGSQLSGMEFRGSCLRRADFGNARLHRTSFENADLSCAVIGAAAASVEAVHRDYADLNCAYLTENYRGANLYRVRAPAAWLAHAFSNGAICRGPDGTNYAAKDCPMPSSTAQAADPLCLEPSLPTCE